MTRTGYKIERDRGDGTWRDVHQCNDLQHAVDYMIAHKGKSRVVEVSTSEHVVLTSESVEAFAPSLERVK